MTLPTPEPRAAGQPAASSSPGAEWGEEPAAPSLPDGQPDAQPGTAGDRRGLFHHVELWVDDLATAEAQWAPVLLALGCEPFQHWPAGRSWRLGAAYLVIEQSPALLPGGHQRLRAGLNHLAVHGSREAVAAALSAGWTVRVDTGEAAHLIDGQGFELEVVYRAAPADPSGATPGANGANGV
ncbi:glyoxalase [Kitasatospora sp. NPDC088351]|uniref:glyoxalase n=1 Tax=unclassified Kitasatospora TaxID=2633591 RepID=UPI00344AC6FB